MYSFVAQKYKKVSHFHLTQLSTLSYPFHTQLTMKDSIYDIVWTPLTTTSENAGDQIRFVEYFFDDSDWETDDSNKHSTSSVYEQRLQNATSETSSAATNTATTIPYNPEGSLHSSTGLITNSAAEDPEPTHRAYFRYGRYRATFSCVEVRGPLPRRLYADYPTSPSPISSCKK
jgi:hypothetical protein